MKQSKKTERDERLARGIRELWEFEDRSNQKRLKVANASLADKVIIAGALHEAIKKD